MNKNGIKVSIIVPVYKVEKYLIQCLNSIINQTLNEIEVIIVDEGEMDRCRRIIDYFESIDDRVITIHERNGGYGSSCNKAIRLAKGEYIGIVESDDWIEPNMFEKLYSQSIKTPCDIIKCSFDYIRNNKSLKPDDARDFLIRQVPQARPFNIRDFPCILASHPSIWCGIYRKDFLKEHLFVEASGSGYVDAEFYFDTYIHAKDIVYLPSVLYHWRIDNDLSSCNNIMPDVLLKRWEHNINKIKDNKCLCEEIGSSVAAKIYISILRRFVSEPGLFNVEQIVKVSQMLTLFTVEQINNAPLINAAERNYLMECRENPKSFYTKRKNAKRKKCNKFYNKVNVVFNELMKPLSRDWIFQVFLVATLFLLLLNSCSMFVEYFPPPIRIGLCWFVFAISLFLGLFLLFGFFIRSLDKLLK